jgi:hypothetical protein
MVQTAADLQQLKGVGRVLAKRLFDAGFDSFAKIAQAGEEGLKKVRGVPPRTVGSILEQAKQLSQSAKSGPAERDEALRKHLSEVREKVESLARGARDRFQEQLTGKCGRKLAADLVRIEDALRQMDDGGKKSAKRAGKALVKAEKRVTGLEEVGLKKLRKGLKRARKAVLKGVK